MHRIMVSLLRFITCALLTAAAHRTVLTGALAQGTSQPQEIPTAPRRTTTAPVSQPKSPPDALAKPLSKTPDQEEQTRPAAMAATTSVQRREGEARFSEGTADWSAAITLRQEAVEVARKENNPEALAEALLNYARVRERGAALAAIGPASLTEAAKAYSDIIAIGTPAQKLVAQNNLGTLYLLQKKPDEALQVLQSMSFENAGASDTYIYAYNTARALEQTRRPAQAFNLYAKALEAVPGFEPAINGAFRVARESGPTGLAFLIGLTGRLIERGQAERLVPPLRESLKDWATNPRLPLLLAQLVRCYAELSLEPAIFEKSEWPAIAPLLDSRIGLAVKEVRSAFSDSLPVTLYAPTEVGPIRAWRREPGQARSFGLLLRRLGDVYREHNNFNQALARYALAWSMNPEDVEAALYAADLLREQGLIVDPSGRVLELLIEYLFESKAQAYRSENWLNILRLHAVLGAIYVRQKRWGQPYEAKGALYQFEHALMAEGEYRAKNPNAPRSPGLYAELANVYLHLNRPADARKQYLAATEVYIRQNRGKEAREMLESAKSIRSDRSRSDLDKIYALEGQLLEIPIV